MRVRATVTVKFPESLPDEIVKLKILSHAPSAVEKRTAIWTRGQGSVLGTLTVELEIHKRDMEVLMNIVDEDWVDDGMVLIMPINATYESQCVMAKKEKKDDQNSSEGSDGGR